MRENKSKGGGRHTFAASSRERRALVEAVGRLLLACGALAFASVFWVSVVLFFGGFFP